jgi:hypothetical protein
MAKHDFIWWFAWLAWLYLGFAWLYLEGLHD